MQPDRRASKRYDIELAVHFRVFVSRHMVHTGKGKTANMSSRGVLFRSGTPLTPGVNLELTVIWPVLFENRFPLQLRILGRVVRQDDRGTAVRVLHSWFSRVLTLDEEDIESSGQPGIEFENDLSMREAG